MIVSKRKMELKGGRLSVFPVQNHIANMWFKQGEMGEKCVSAAKQG